MDPEQDVVDVPIVSDACIPPLELHLYNSTGITCMDLQYDPMTLFRRGQASNSNSKALSEDKKGLRTKMASEQTSGLVVTLLALTCTMKSFLF